MWPQQEDKKKRDKNKEEVVCPSCGHSQLEPHIAISTFCRGCGDYYSLAEARRRMKAPAPGATGAASSSPPRAAPRDREKTRRVSCFQCQCVHEVSREAESSICPRCSAYISLKDEEVNGQRNSSIQTRGDVKITKRGSMTAGKVGCDNLTVHGQLASSVDCSGTATFKTSGNILGEIHCVRLVVERKSQLRFHRPVHASDVEIHGNVLGDFICDGTISIRRKGSILGDVVCRSLVLQKGAVLVGEVTTPPPNEEPREEESAGTVTSAGGSSATSTEGMAANPIRR